MSRLLALAVAAALSSGAAAQATLDPDSQQVQLLAPQLLAFAGSPGNFNAIVAGLTGNLPVTITSFDASGNLQIVTFEPPGTLTPLDAARVLENARQSLIARGIATPNAQQLAVSLVGGTLDTPLGTTTLSGTVPGVTSALPVQVRIEPTGFASIPGVASPAIAQTQALRASLAQQGLSPLEINQSLQLAGIILAQQGIVAPTPEQLQVALTGGNLALANGQTVPVRGVLEGRLPASGFPTAGTTIGFPTAGTLPPATTTPPPATTAAPGNIPSALAPAGTLPIGPNAASGGATSTPLTGATAVPSAGVPVPQSTPPSVPRPGAR